MTTERVIRLNGAALASYRFRRGMISFAITST